MSLKEFCLALQQCAQKLEEEVKINLNDLMNKLYSHSMSETKMSLEKAKDYHYKEILDALGEVLRQIKKVLFHQDQVEWLNNEENFTKDELRRFSYVKRQVYAFSKTDDVALPSVKRRERRRTTSEISVGSLDAWEKYLDQKEQEESQIPAQAEEVKTLVPKRTLSNARRRKKFVSSTQIGFLEDGNGSMDSLDSILEDDSSVDDTKDISAISDEDLDARSKSEDVSLIQLVSNTKEAKRTLSSDRMMKKLVSFNVGNETMDSLDSILEDEPFADEELCELAASNDNAGEPSVASDDGDKVSDDGSRRSEDLNAENGNDGVSSGLLVDTKPRIVDVIYKNRPV